MKRIVFHVDIDAFYASVEQRDDESLKNKPIAVGGKSDRGVVTTASYEARVYGVRSAMSVVKAKKLCPNLIIVPGNREKYKIASNKMFGILNRYSNKVEKISIDEAFIEIEDRDYLEIAKNIKKDILEEIGLTISIGISYNKFLAKLASDMDKPNGITIISKKDTDKILKPLKVGKIFGVGPKMVEELNTLGIYYIEDIQNYDRDVLEKKFGKRGKDIYEFSYGRDLRELDCNEVTQSIGEEETFLEDVSEIDFLYKKLYEHSESLEMILKRKNLLYNTITVKIKYSDFTIETRSLTLTLPDSNKDKIYELSKYILDKKFKIEKPVRLIGVTLSNLIYPDDPIQMSIELKNDDLLTKYKK